MADARGQKISARIFLCLKNQTGASPGQTRREPILPAKVFDLRRKKIKLTLRFVDGVIAQLVERLNGIQEVRSSSLLGSTISNGFHPISPCRSACGKTVVAGDPSQRVPAGRRSPLATSVNGPSCTRSPTCVS